MILAIVTTICFCPKYSANVPRPYPGVTSILHAPTPGLLQQFQEWQISTNASLLCRAGSEAAECAWDTALHSQPCQGCCALELNRSSDPVQLLWKPPINTQGLCWQACIRFIPPGQSSHLFSHRECPWVPCRFSVGNLVTGQSADLTACSVSLPSWGFWGGGRGRRGKALQDWVEREALAYFLPLRTRSEASRLALGVI